MPELSVSEAQLQRLESVREDLEAAYVGPYGTISREEALEYLLDTYTPPEEHDAAAEEAGDAAAETDDTGGETAEPEHETTATDAESDTDAEPAGDLTDIAGVGEATAEALAAAGFDSIAAVRDADPADLTAVDGIADKQAIDIKAEVAGFDGTEHEDGAADGEDATETEAGPGESENESPENTLQQAMSLLDQHDDKWRESSGDEPYEVDLPDGGTEAVRTKDDIKRLLFKHWR
ncbi:helix-hairpin-helix domain-containing protein [Natronomonas amylolytica]|uniref:helix-hairpin-helix domain-containing protein n=1 Tax=Natronomonas amylolytica TaxID=3108498 RepID=UPI003008045B